MKLFKDYMSRVTLRRISAAGLALLVSLLVVSCGANPFVVFIGADQAGQTAIFVASNVSEAATAGLQYSALTANPAAAVDQTIELTFLNGLVDEDTVDTGIMIYPLSDAADVNSVYVRGTAITKSDIVVLPVNTGSSVVRFTVDLNGTTISNLLEMAMDPAILTANNGAIKLNQDGDDLPGETQDDAVVAYITVTGGAAVTLATGVQKVDPQQTVTLNMGAAAGFTNGSVSITANASNSGLTFTDMTADSLASSVTFRKYSFDTTAGTWSLVDNADTPTYDSGTGVVTFTLATAIANLDVYRIDWDLSSVSESTAFRGFTHTGTTDIAYAGSTRYVSVGGFEGYAAAPSSANGANSSWYVDIDYTGTELIEATVSSSSIRVYNVDTGTFVPDSLIADVSKIGVLTVRIEMAQPFVPVSGTTYRIVSYPTLRDDNGTPTDTTDDRAYGSTTGAFIPGLNSAIFVFGL